MKQINIFKKLLLVTFLGASGAANAQAIHPLAFGTALGYTNPNFYANYVGLRFEVVSPSVVAGDKQYTTPGGTGTGAWGGVVTTPILNKQIVMPQAGDSLCTSSISVGMVGKIGFVYRGTNEFGAKALACQNAGAIACVIVNNVAGNPVGMAAGASGGSVTIPVFQISKADGDAIDVQYNLGTIATMTITPWGLGFANDLGFVPGGIALWHNYAIPSNQIAAGGISAYQGLDGAFVANYGTGTMSNVSVTDTLTFTSSEGGGPTSVHTGTSPVQASFPAADSIYAFFSPTQFDVTASATGRFDLKYTINSTTTDDYPADNTLTTSFYSSDSVYSKGTYDFTAKQPVNGTYEAFNANGEFLWGNMYYVAVGGASVSGVQYSMFQNPPTGSLTPIGDFTAASGNNVLLFTWVDGSGGQPKDSIVENGELTLVGLNAYSFTSGIDTSAAEIKSPIGDASGAVVPGGILLNSNTWYYLCVDVPPSLFLGCDGILDPYPRIFGRAHATNGILDYSNMVFLSQSAITGSPANENLPEPSTDASAVDSFNYNSQKGLIPAVALIVNNKPDTSLRHVGVQDATSPIGIVNVYPNPASDYLNVSVSLSQTAPTVTYTLIDGLARIIGKEVHNNVKDEVYTIPTANMAAGTYFLIINANKQVTSKTFTVIK